MYMNKKQRENEKKIEELNRTVSKINERIDKIDRPYTRLIVRNRNPDEVRC